MATRMQQRRGTETQWTTANPILNAGEIGFESDTNKFKIGDGINHWADLAYFADVVTLGGSIDDYIPLTQKGQPNGVAELDGNGKLASLQIPNLDEITQDILDTSLVAGTGLDKTYNDNAGTYTLDIDSTVATKTYADTAASSAVSTHSSDTTDVHGITDTAELATKAFAASLLTGATKSNITITGDKNGLTISAENGVADSTTDNLTEGSTNKYFTDERAQDAVGNSVGTGLSYDDASGAISVNTTTIQARVSGVSDTEIGYLDGVTSGIQTQLDAKVAKSGSTMTGALTLSGAPTSDLHAATKLYVDNVTAGINFHQAVHVATTANLSADYNNGTDGVGATLTATANGTWTTLDGHTSFTQYDRVLVKDQTDAKQNGIYVLSDLGSGSSKWILTRATDADNNPSGEMKNGDFVLVLNGTVNASYGFVNNSATNPIAIGTDNITYTAFNAAKTVAAGNGLQEATPGVLSIDTSITQARVSGVSDTEIGYLDGVTSSIQTQLDAKAPLASPTFTGTVTIPNGAALGIPASVTLTNATGLPVSTGISGLGTGVATALAVNTGSAGAVALFNGALGTPSSVTLTNATGLPVATGISGLGTGVATFLASPTAANLASMVTDEIGSGSLMFSELPTNAQSASYTLVLADKMKIVEMNVGSANNLTVPLNASVAFPVGTQINIVQTGAGQTTVVATGGVTINTATTLKLRAQWSAATLIKRAENTWVLVGDLATS